MLAMECLQLLDVTQIAVLSNNSLALVYIESVNSATVLC